MKTGGVTPEEFENLKDRIRQAWGQSDKIYGLLAEFVDRVVFDLDSNEKKMSCAVMFGELYGTYRLTGEGADAFFSALDIIRTPRTVA